MAKAISFHTNWRASRYVPCHLIATCSIASARLPWAPESRGIPAADDLESVECVHVRFKELDPIPQFKATAKLGEFLGSTLTVVLARREV